MADINNPHKNAGSEPSGRRADNGLSKSGETFDEAALVELIELIFFAYRDFIEDPDAILQQFGFGRAHHRVLHFVDQYPGLRVADLLKILKITKQSLARVLKQLVDEGYIEQRPGASDRRERRLFTTDAGQQLAARLIEPQLARLKRAIGPSGLENSVVNRAFLYNMINAEERDEVNQLFARPDVGREARGEAAGTKHGKNGKNGKNGAG